MHRLQVGGSWCARRALEDAWKTRLGSRCPRPYLVLGPTRHVSAYSKRRDSVPGGSVGEERTEKKTCSGEACKGKVVVLAGPTGVGKTAVSLELAQRLVRDGLGAEIISADSVQVYKGLDVGSRKLDCSERVRLLTDHDVRHHLIDVLSPTSQYTAGDFYSQATRIAKDILQRGKTPIVVGGTGFWLRWFVQGRPQTPRSQAKRRDQARQRIEEAAASAEGEEMRWTSAVSLLAEAGDPETAQRLNRNDYFRLERALEVVLATGKPMRAHLPESATEAGVTGSHGDPGFDLRCFFLYPSSRLRLYERLDWSCQEMVLGGLLEETKALLDLGLTPGTNTATNAVGYRQFMEYFRERAPPGEGGGSPDEAFRGFAEVVLDVQKQTRRLAQDQLTWFRNESAFEWMEITTPGVSESPRGGGEASLSQAVDSIHASLLRQEERGRVWDNTGMGYLCRAEERRLKGYQGGIELIERNKALVLDKVARIVSAM